LIALVGMAMATRPLRSLIRAENGVRITPLTPGCSLP
jgi:hypothetical protein